VQIEDRMEILLIVSVVFALSGYLLPIPCLVLAWREFLGADENESVKPWRRVVSKAGLALASLGLVLWLYAVARELLGNYSYYAPSAVVGRWGMAGLIIVCSFARPGLRRYLLLAAIGLYIFFDSSIGDWFI
jgi:hypothetical protein